MGRRRVPHYVWEAPTVLICGIQQRNSRPHGCWHGGAKSNRLTPIREPRWMPSAVRGTRTPRVALTRLMFTVAVVPSARALFQPRAGSCLSACRGHRDLNTTLAQPISPTTLTEIAARLFTIQFSNNVFDHAQPHRCSVTVPKIRDTHVPAPGPGIEPDLHHRAKPALAAACRRCAHSQRRAPARRP